MSRRAMRNEKGTDIDGDASAPGWLHGGAELQHARPFFTTKHEHSITYYNSTCGMSFAYEL
jgi:hypothetical protein